MKRVFLSLIVITALLWGSVARAGYGPESVKAAGDSMVKHGVVKGRADGGLALDDTITRAELMTIMVRAFGKEETAKLLSAAVPYPDVKGHWAAGYIALASSMMQERGASVGLPDGTFNPSGRVTAAEAVAFLSKFMGVQPTTDAWPNNYLQGAANAGLLSQTDRDLLQPQASTPATRGLVFYLLDNAFSGYKLQDGKTVYQEYLGEPAPTPTVEPTPTPTPTPTVEPTPTPTPTPTHPAPTGDPQLTPVTDGSITAHVDNPVLTPKESTQLWIMVKDKNGDLVSGADYDVKVISNAQGHEFGTFDKATSTFTAGITHGEVTLRITSGSLPPFDVLIVIEAGPAKQILVSPTDLSLPVGVEVDFQAIGIDEYQNGAALTDVQWSASKGNIRNGRWTSAGEPGETVTITATQNGISGTAVVNITQ